MASAVLEKIGPTDPVTGKGSPVDVALVDDWMGQGISNEGELSNRADRRTAAGIVLSGVVADASKLLQRSAIWSVDRSLMSADEAAGVLINGSYIKNPSAQNIIANVSSSGKLQFNGQVANGQFMYVVDLRGNVIIGTRSGQRMPHPTLIGGSDPKVLSAGIVEIRGGKIYKIDNVSGHFKPGVGSLANSESAFGRLPERYFSQDFQGYKPFEK